MTSSQVSASQPFHKVLIANRGEIAVRIIRAAHAIGAKAVAVYSEADERSLHALYADEAYCIGPGPATESYLNVAAILAAARTANVDAIHPGYGFLSENSDFAHATVDAGLAFVGPPPEVIRLMGDKVAAKQLAGEQGVPLIPGYDGADQSHERLSTEAARIGYPVMLKAAAGGGGRGMRMVESSEDLLGAIEGARREAEGAFGDGRLFVEKLLVAPRHVEVQVFGDSHGNVVHLYERDCSVQRRHQKVVEEAPSPALDETQRRDICNAAVAVARAANYINAGTVEFLWQDGEFYFLEMNTRIQVEHGVTELVTGADLVVAQLLVAAGLTLPWCQDEIKRDGHAIEARLYAEDPDQEFLPQTGLINRISFGAAGSRIDTGVGDGSEIPRFYDAMIAKIMVKANGRDQALNQLNVALDETFVDGPTTNLSFLRWVAESPEFRRGTATTNFAENWLGSHGSGSDDEWVLGMLATSITADATVSIWTDSAGWRQGGQGVRITCEINEVEHTICADRGREGVWRAIVDGERTYEQVIVDRGPMGSAILRSEGRVSAFIWTVTPGELAGSIRRLGSDDGEERLVRLRSGLDSVDNAQGGPGTGAHSGVVRSPMPGAIMRILVVESEQVRDRQPLLVLEAMKMEHVLEAPLSGVVARIHRVEGDVVPAGEPLVDIRTG